MNNRIQKHRLLPHSRETVWYRRYLTINGRTVCLLWIEDYRPCRQGGFPRSYVKLIKNPRYKPGMRTPKHEQAFDEQIVAKVIPGEWTEIVLSFGVNEAA
ncbi:hypothetical protein [Azonexus sp.]|jgi:hypothetical protein|uniref:hypothetical protein n=1 Tax=Azonexus sp. TaxID=1872668 RepID=UPI002835868B|nr:hypothetical protein [Azonexus sp.]MDR1995130.1 hypothetical protein [Azonexus sp.]